MYLSRHQFFPFISFVGTYYFVFHGLLSLYASLWVVHLSHLRYISADPVVFISAFAAIQVLVFYVLARIFPPRPRANEPADYANVKIFAWACVAASLLFNYFPVLGTLPSLPQLHQPLWLCGVGCLAYLYFSKRPTWWEAFCALMALTTKFFHEFHTSLLTLTVLTFVVILCAAIALKRWKVSLLMVCICTVMIASYAYPKHFLRTELRGEQFGLFRFNFDLSFSSIEASINSMARRSSHSLWTAQVMEKTPSEIPFVDRAPLIDSMVNHVPRVFWPAKPREIYGNDFGKRYGFIFADDNLTSWNIPWTADLYMTSGVVGALLKVVILAAGIFAICRWLAGHRDRTFAFGLHSAAVFPLFQQSSNVSLMIGNIMVILVSLYAGYFMVGFGVKRVRPLLHGRPKTPAD